jgi:hypothetical protein
MKTKEFKEYLELKFPNQPANVSTIIAVCQRVEKHHGNLDTHFAEDKFEQILYLLTYTAEDERQKRQAKHQIPTTGNLRNNTSTLKSRTTLYKAFLEQNQSRRIPDNSIPEDSNSGYIQTGTKIKRRLSLRSIDAIFESEEELHEFFEDNVVSYSESPDDVNDCRLLAYRYFKSFAGEWYFRTDENNTYLKIIPSKIAGSSRLKTFFTDLFNITEGNIEELLTSFWADDDDYTTKFDPEDFYFEIKEEEDIRKNITG